MLYPDSAPRPAVRTVGPHVTDVVVRAGHAVVARPSDVRPYQTGAATDAAELLD